MNYLKNKIATAGLTLALLANSVVPAYAGWKEIKESLNNTTEKSWNYVKAHKWYFIAGTAVAAGAVIYSNNQENERKKNAPEADKDGDGYTNAEEDREGSGDGGEPQDGSWGLSPAPHQYNAQSLENSVMENKMTETKTSLTFPVYVKTGKNTSLVGEFGKDKSKVYFNYRF